MEVYKYYSCEDHIECVIDDFINSYEVTPNMDIIDNNICCNYCDNCAKYILTYEYYN